jgi:hypothetical protein
MVMAVHVLINLYLPAAGFVPDNFVRLVRNLSVGDSGHVFFFRVTLVVNNYHIIIPDTLCLGCFIHHVARDINLPL